MAQIDPRSLTRIYDRARYDPEDSFTPDQLDIISRIAAGDPEARAKYLIDWRDIPEPRCCIDVPYAFDPD